MGILLPIISEFDSRGIDRAVKEFAALEGAGAKAGFALKKAALPAAAAIAGLAAGLGSATKAAMEDAAAQEHLAGVLKRSGMATDDQIAINEKLLSVMSRSAAVADDELRPALATLVQSTGSLEYSQELLSAALDISASTGKDLTTVTDALSKAYNGNMKGLKALDASLIPLIADGQSFDDVMIALAGTTGGAAADAANTAAGRMANLKIQMDETKESIGAALLPVVQKLLDILLPVAYWAQENTGLFLGFAAVIGGLSIAVLAANAAMKIYQATLVIVKVAQAALNFVMSANPIGLIVIAIAAVVAAFIVLEKRFGLVSAAVEVIGNAFYKFLIQPISTAISLIGKLISALGKIPGLGALGSVVGGAIKGIPGLAAGGIVTQPTLAMIGEAGPEAVIPLNRLGGGGGGITVNVMGGLATSAEIGQAVVNAIRAYNRSAGPANIAVA
jgi:hypothetical protein